MSRRSVSCAQRSAALRPAATLAVAVLAVASALSAQATEVKKPDCAALEAWAAGIDGADRWQPVEGYRGWVPRAFEAPEFEAMFGVPVLEWRSEDAVGVANHVLDCGRQADKAKRADASKALYAARRYLQSNLRGVLGTKEKLELRAEREAQRAAARAQQEAARREERSAAQQARAQSMQDKRDAVVEEALAALLDEPASPQQLRTLALLRSLDINDRASYERAQRRVGPAARTLMFRLHQQGSDLKDPRVAPRIEERYATLKDEIVADYRAKLANLNNSGESLRFLSGWQQEVGQQLATMLGPETTSAMLEEMTAKGTSIREAILVRAKELIDAADGNTQDDAAELALIDRIVANSARAGLTPDQLTEVRVYAAGRQQVLAQRMLDVARAELAGYPETLDGLDKLRRQLHATWGGPLRRAGEAAFADYVAAAQERLTRIADAALPEFRRKLADIPESPEGLQMLDATLVKEPGFDAVGEDVRASYLAAVDDRRTSIATVLEAKEAARREAAIAAGGDPELVGYSFVDGEHFTQLEFRDEKLVIMNVMGIRAAADYQVSAGDVIVRGPNGTLVLARSGSGEKLKLSGMGLVLKRATE